MPDSAMPMASLRPVATSSTCSSVSGPDGTGGGAGCCCCAPAAVATTRAQATANSASRAPQLNRSTSISKEFLPRPLEQVRRLRAPPRPGGLSLKPGDVFGARLERLRHVIHDRSEIAVIELTIELLHPLLKRPVQRSDPVNAAPDDFDQHPPPVRRVAAPRHEPAAFEPIDDRGRRATRQTGVLRQLAGGGRSGQQQEIETFKVGRIEADQPGDEIADEHRLRADLAQRLVDLLQQLGAGASRHIGTVMLNILIIKILDI